jgi:hypothetical protein
MSPYDDSRGHDHCSLVQSTINTLPLRRVIPAAGRRWKGTPVAGVASKQFYRSCDERVDQFWNVGDMCSSNLRYARLQLGGW